tara:strand:- start:366 stop:2228 length:1863 start_codon:yes stop_codon:yes gene_type:complete
MSIVEKLTEGIVNRDMAQEGAALLNKWGQTGLLEGLQNDHQKSTMARLLENQAKELLREASSLGAGDVEGFAAVAFPIVRRVFAGLIANDLVSVQPMSLPSGLIFFLDFSFGDQEGGNGVSGSRMGNTQGGTESIYGTDKLGSEVITGVGLTDSLKGDLSGPGRSGMVGYAYASPSGSNVAAFTNSDHIKVRSAFKLDGSVSETRAKYIQYDPDLLASTTLGVVVVDVNQAEIESVADAADADFDNLSAFVFDKAALLTYLNGVTGGSAIGTITAVANISQVRRLTRKVAAADSATGAAAVRFVISLDEPAQITTESDTATNGAGDLAIGKLSFPIVDHLPAAGTVGAVGSSSNNFALEGSENIPEIDIKVDSTAITAQTKKLKAKWTPELGQDLNAYHNLDAEVELTSILSEQIALEIDREILSDLVRGATAATYYWSRSPGLFVNRSTGAELGATAAAPDFTGTVSEWYETLIETINDVSAQIHRKTLRGGANYVVVSPEGANILEFTSGFRANVTADADKGDIGAVKAGSLSRKFDVIVDPYFPRNLILVGRKGSSFLESGYVYAPYVPLQTTPTIFGPEDFVPRKGVMTRYAKKMVRPDMYGLVIIRGLLGESGAS